MDDLAESVSPEPRPTPGPETLPGISSHPRIPKGRMLGHRQHPDDGEIAEAQAGESLLRHRVSGRDPK